ncbi:isocitrate/isopropylmalate family dehydrogenase [Sphingomicrobium sediminis]|uniref:Isocitrate/isopropylmalate family dehydrogenase n=1 Tax=Sphingomicrobium sediminis TaxID=2950949 RepID=A0A9X2EF41_9SPHN|nr:isocitrate/isopropylmalate family dehydrogenase [Sphingomicrobium sediminis]MCM8556415.1 isocitrate/isopropylmalate family dehydrogenase [Sphingomicrobium sediminis]
MDQLSATSTLRANSETVRPRLTDTLCNPLHRADAPKDVRIGMFLGEGVGPEVVPVAMSMLEPLGKAFGRKVEIVEGGLIGLPAKAAHGDSLSDEVIAFSRQLMAKGGALFCGPGGGRFVYALRREFDLYCKFTPLEPLPELVGVGAVRAKQLAATDIIAVRENMGGIYQGDWTDGPGDNGRTVTHSFGYDEQQVKRIAGVAARLAATRRGQVHLVTKPGGIPTISSLWRDICEAACAREGVSLTEFEIDNAVYQLIANPGQFDVLVSPNMFGDVLADCGSLLLGSRGLSYSGNFNDDHGAVYQTGHGAARDIAGKGIANPAAQILSLGMMLRESFGWAEADALLRSALRRTYADGIATADVASDGQVAVGTQAFGEEVRRRLDMLLEAR